MTALSSPHRHPLRLEILVLLQVAMLVFTWTVVIGILNGTDIVDFSRKTVLSHVHAGTLGWITTAVLAAALWLFGEHVVPGSKTALAARILTVAAVIVLPAFAFTFALTYGTGRAHMGGLAATVIAAFLIWVLTRVRSVDLTVPHLGFLAAIATSVAGAVLGVLLATEIATGNNVAPENIDGAHPGTMVIGFLVPVGMALAEWGFRWGKLTPPGRLGTAQMALPFVGGMILMTGLLLDIDALPPIGALIELIGVVLFVIRMWPSFRATNWLQPSTARFAATASIAIILNLIFINYLLSKYEGDFDLVPDNQLLAESHMMFIGVLTNAIFALLLGLNGVERRYRILDQVVFWAVNVGLVGFLIGLLADTTFMKRISTPVMGTAILLALAMYTWRLWASRQDEGSPLAAPAAVR